MLFNNLGLMWQVLTLSDLAETISLLQMLATLQKFPSKKFGDRFLATIVISSMSFCSLKEIKILMGKAPAKKSKRTSKNPEVEWEITFFKCSSFQRDPLCQNVNHFKGSQRRSNGSSTSLQHQDFKNINPSFRRWELFLQKSCRGKNIQRRGDH